MYLYIYMECRIFIHFTCMCLDSVVAENVGEQVFSVSENSEKTGSEEEVTTRIHLHIEEPCLEEECNVLHSLSGKTDTDSDSGQVCPILSKTSELSTAHNIAFHQNTGILI